jgi:uncharacterized phage protein gp47/JayE
MLSPRSVDEIQQDYFSALIQSGSGLVVDRIEGSLAYTLSRASSVIAAQQDYRLIESQANTSILTATGEYLDRIGSSFLVREGAQVATGFVMMRSFEQNIQIPQLTSLVYLENGLEFYTVNSGVVTVYPFLNTVIPVVSLNPGAEHNLPAGTKLFSPDFPDTQVIVGSNYTDRYYGDLIGGRDVEPDLSYRNRLIAYLSRSSSSTQSTIEAKLLQYPLVERVYVRTSIPGVVEIWLDSEQNYTDRQREEILTYIRPDISMGVIPVIIQARRKVVDVHVEMRPYSGRDADLNNLTQRVNAIVTAAVKSLGIGDTFSIQTVEGLISPLVRSVKIIEPTEDIVSLSDEVIVLGDIKVTYPAASTWYQNI